MAILTMENLVTPAGLAPFLAAVASNTRWALSAARAPETATLLSWPVIEGLIANSLVPLDCFRVVVNGHEVPRTLYGDDRGRLRADAIQGFATQGATFSIIDIGALVLPIGELATAMERELRCRVHVNCYITFGAVSAFIPHYDAHDVLALQIHGVKRWQGFGSSVAFPLKGGRVSGRAPAWENVLSPGDLLYLPRGEIHAAIPEARPCVHLTFGIYEPTGVDFLNWLAKQAEESEALRRGVGPTLDGDSRAARDREFGQVLRSLLEAATLDDFFADQDRQRSLRPLATLQGLGGGNRFPPETCLVSALRRRTDLAVHQEGELPLTLGKRPLRLSRLARQALAEITRGSRLSVAALAERIGRKSGDAEFAACLEELAAKALIAAVE